MQDDYLTYSHLTSHVQHVIKCGLNTKHTQHSQVTAAHGRLLQTAAFQLTECWAKITASFDPGQGYSSQGCSLQSLPHRARPLRALSSEGFALQGSFLQALAHSALPVGALHQIADWHAVFEVSVTSSVHPA